MKAQISYKNILKATLATVILITVFFAYLIWVFGDEAKLKTEISRTPNVANFEELKKITSPAQNNLTDEVSNAIAKEIASLNPEGPVTDEFGTEQIAALDPDKIVEKSLEEGLKTFNPDQLRYTANLNLINKTNSNIKERQAQYFSDMETTINKAFEGSTTINYENFPQTNFSEIISRYEVVIADLYKIQTPSDLLNYHVNLISLLGTHKNIYAVLANFENDPLQAYLAAEFGLQIENEIAFLFNEMNKYIKDNEIFAS